MKFIFIFLFIITFVCLLGSSIFLETSLFNDILFEYEKKMPIFTYLQNVQFISSLLFASFIIAYANYSIKLNGYTLIKKVIQLIGLSFIVLIVFNLLDFYYTTRLTMDDLEKSSFKYTSANNTISDASQAYVMTGNLIEYYDEYSEINKFEPSQSDIELREMNIMIKNKIDLIPLKIVFSFFILIVFYYLGNKIAKWKRHKF